MKYAFILSIALISLFSCSDQQILPVEDKILLEMVEELDTELNITRLEFHLETEKEYPCSNYPIIFDSSWKDSEIEVDIDGVEETEICLTAIGPARGKLGFGNLQELTYEVTFKYKRERINGTLTVSSDKYELELDSDNLVEIVNPVLMK